MYASLSHSQLEYTQLSGEKKPNLRGTILWSFNLSETDLTGAIMPDGNKYK